MTPKTTFEEFLAVVKDDRRTANIDRVTLSLIFDRVSSCKPSSLGRGRKMLMCRSSSRKKPRSRMTTNIRNGNRKKPPTGLGHI